MGAGDAGPRGGDRRCRPADRGTRTCLQLLLLARASSPRLWSTPTKCWISTTPRSIAILPTSSTRSQNFGRYLGSISTWMLGYPDRALRLNNEKDAHARRRGHPFDLGFALTAGAHDFDHRYDHEDLRKRAEECERLGRENSLPVLWAMMAPSLHGPSTDPGRQTRRRNCPAQGRHRVLGSDAAASSAARP